MSAVPGTCIYFFGSSYEPKLHTLSLHALNNLVPTPATASSREGAAAWRRLPACPDTQGVRINAKHIIPKENKIDNDDDNEVDEDKIHNHDGSDEVIGGDAG